MALDGLSLLELSVAQTELLVKAREHGGAHIYYTNGWDVRKKYVEIIPPSGFLVGHKFLLAFYYKLDVRNENHSFSYGQYNHHRKTYVSLLGQKEWKAEYYLQYSRQDIKSKKVSTPMRGFHVFEMKRESDGLTMYLDKQAMHEKKITDNSLNEFRVIFCDQNSTSDFIFWEMHYKPKNLTSDFAGQGYRFIHKNHYIGMGGYVMFRGTWKETNLHVNTSQGDLGHVQATGTLGLMLHVYKDGYAVWTTMGASTMSKKTDSHAILMDVGCTKPEKMEDLVYVMGEYIE